MMDKVIDFELCVVGFEKNPAHCIYLNEFRIVGSKPWGGGRTTAQWRVTLSDLRQALPELDISVRSTPSGAS